MSIYVESRHLSGYNVYLWQARRSPYRHGLACLVLERSLGIAAAGPPPSRGSRLKFREDAAFVRTRRWRTPVRQPGQDTVTV